MNWKFRRQRQASQHWHKPYTVFEHCEESRSLATSYLYGCAYWLITLSRSDDHQTANAVDFDNEWFAIRPSLPIVPTGLD